jgi:NarL family two-component system sensor histidine kinase YdfH
VERFTTATGIPCTLEMPSELAVSERDGEHVVRCVSEGLANVARHAQSTEVWVTIAEDNGRLSIQIQDNGKGFNTETSIPSGHYGLLGLRERARLANGELTVESKVGEGTTLTMWIPNNQQSTDNSQQPTDHASRITKDEVSV